MEYCTNNMPCFCPIRLLAQVNLLKYNVTVKKGVFPLGGKASAASKNAWNAKAYDRINLTVPKGLKEEIKAYAESCGESVNGFINRLIEQEMGKGKKGRD